VEPGTSRCREQSSCISCGINGAVTQEARLSMKENVFDVIVIDRDLPVVHGRHILDDIAELQPNARVIGLSDNDDRIRDMQVDPEMTKSGKNLNDIILLMEKISISA
jgi:DNA-binding NarL/FixJ family response regulator